MDRTTLLIPVIAGLVMEILGLSGAALAGISASILLHQAMALEHAKHMNMPRAAHFGKAALAALMITFATTTTMSDGGFGYWLTGHHMR